MLPETTMGERLEITAFPVEMKSTLDISADVRMDPEKVRGEVTSEKSSIAGDIYNADR